MPRPDEKPDDDGKTMVDLLRPDMDAAEPAGRTPISVQELQTQPESSSIANVVFLESEDANMLRGIAGQKVHSNRFNGIQNEEARKHLSQGDDLLIVTGLRIARSPEIPPPAVTFELLTFNNDKNEFTLTPVRADELLLKIEALGMQLGANARRIEQLQQECHAHIARAAELKMKNKRREAPVVVAGLRRVDAACIAILTMGLGLAIGRQFHGQIDDALHKTVSSVADISSRAHQLYTERFGPRGIVHEAEPVRLRDLQGIEAVFEAGIRSVDPKRLTQKDNLLDPYQVTKHFLDGKFWFTGRVTVDLPDDPYEEDNVYGFALIGDRSQFLDRNGEGGERFSSTTLPDAINTLLDYERLSDEQIKQWIAWTYKHSFGINFIPEKIKLDRGKDKKVIWVSYEPPKDFPEKVPLRVPRRIEGAAPNSMQGLPTIESKFVPVLSDSGNRILLQSGVSPDHNLLVPGSLMNHDKPFVLPLGKPLPDKPSQGEYGSWPLTAENIAAALHLQEAAQETSEGRTTSGTTSDGREVHFRVMSGFVTEEGSFPIGLAQFIARGAKTDADRYRMITEYYQKYPYVWENDTDFNRHPMIFHFNGGSDCNNSVVPWSTTLCALKLPHALVHIAPTKDENNGHAVGAIPISGVGKVENGLDVQGHYLTDLTGQIPIGTDIRSGRDIVAIEYITFDEQGKRHVNIVRYDNRPRK